MSEDAQPQGFMPNQPENVPQDVPLDVSIEPFPAEFAGELDKTFDEAVRILCQKGSEPFWMQDVRLAQRAIDAQRQSAARSKDQGVSEAESCDAPGPQ